MLWVGVGSAHAPLEGSSLGPSNGSKIIMLQFALLIEETEARMTQRLALVGSESRLGLGTAASMARSALRATGARGVCMHFPSP